MYPFRSRFAAALTRIIVAYQCLFLALPAGAGGWAGVSSAYAQQSRGGARQPAKPKLVQDSVAVALEEESNSLVEKVARIMLVIRYRNTPDVDLIRKYGRIDLAKAVGLYTAAEQQFLGWKGKVESYLTSPLDPELYSLKRESQKAGKRSMVQNYFLHMTGLIAVRELLRVWMERDNAVGRYAAQYRSYQSRAPFTLWIGEKAIAELTEFEQIVRLKDQSAYGAWLKQMSQSIIPFVAAVDLSQARFNGEGKVGCTLLEDTADAAVASARDTFDASQYSAAERLIHVLASYLVTKRQTLNNLHSRPRELKAVPSELVTRFPDLDGDATGSLNSKTKFLEDLEQDVKVKESLAKNYPFYNRSKEAGVIFSEGMSRGIFTKYTDPGAEIKEEAVQALAAQIQESENKYFRGALADAIRFWPVPIAKMKRPHQIEALRQILAWAKRSPNEAWLNGFIDKFRAALTPEKIQGFRDFFTWYSRDFAVRIPDETLGKWLDAAMAKVPASNRADPRLKARSDYVKDLLVEAAKGQKAATGQDDLEISMPLMVASLLEPQLEKHQWKGAPAEMGDGAKKWIADNVPQFVKDFIPEALNRAGRAVIGGVPQPPKGPTPLAETLPEDVRRAVITWLGKLSEAGGKDFEKGVEKFREVRTVYQQLDAAETAAAKKDPRYAEQGRRHRAEFAALNRIMFDKLGVGVKREKGHAPRLQDIKGLSADEKASYRRAYLALVNARPINTQSVRSSGLELKQHLAGIAGNLQTPDKVTSSQIQRAGRRVDEAIDAELDAIERDLQMVAALPKGDFYAVSRLVGDSGMIRQTLLEQAPQFAQYADQLQEIIATKNNDLEYWRQVGNAYASPAMKLMAIYGATLLTKWIFGRFAWGRAVGGFGDRLMAPAALYLLSTMLVQAHQRYILEPVEISRLKADSLVKEQFFYTSSMPDSVFTYDQLVGSRDLVMIREDMHVFSIWLESAMYALMILGPPVKAGIEWSLAKIEANRILSYMETLGISNRALLTADIEGAKQAALGAGNLSAGQIRRINVAARELLNARKRIQAILDNVMARKADALQALGIRSSTELGPDELAAANAAIQRSSASAAAKARADAAYLELMRALRPIHGVWKPGVLRNFLNSKFGDADIVKRDVIQSVFDLNELSYTSPDPFKARAVLTGEFENGVRRIDVTGDYRRLGVKPTDPLDSIVKKADEVIESLLARIAKASDRKKPELQRELDKVRGAMERVLRHKMQVYHTLVGNPTNSELPTAERMAKEVVQRQIAELKKNKLNNVLQFWRLRDLQKLNGRIEEALRFIEAENNAGSPGEYIDRQMGRMPRLGGGGSGGAGGGGILPPPTGGSGPGAGGVDPNDPFAILEDLTPANQRFRRLEIPGNEPAPAGDPAHPSEPLPPTGPDLDDPTYQRFSRLFEGEGHDVLAGVEPAGAPKPPAVEEPPQVDPTTARFRSLEIPGDAPAGGAAPGGSDPLPPSTSSRFQNLETGDAGEGGGGLFGWFSRAFRRGRGQPAAGAPAAGGDRFRNLEIPGAPQRPADPAAHDVLGRFRPSRGRPAPAPAQPEPPVDPTDGRFAHIEPVGTPPAAPAPAAAGARAPGVSYDPNTEIGDAIVHAGLSESDVGLPIPKLRSELAAAEARNAELLAEAQKSGPLSDEMIHREGVAQIAGEVALRKVDRALAIAGQTGLNTNQSLLMLEFDAQAARAAALQRGDQAAVKLLDELLAVLR